MTFREIAHSVVMFVAPAAGLATIGTAATGHSEAAACYGSVGGAASILWLFFDWLNDREFRNDINQAAEVES